ncbi:MAG TPA: KH domain-containing protein [Deltaproteobacteria bacterium]|nr:KH domain-containing protein [Deltaproteobacteria bacterium]
MEDLVRHLVEPIVDEPDAVSIQTIERESVIILELVVDPDDKEELEGDKGRTLRAIRNILSAAAGRRKATLDLVDEHGDADEE